MGEVNGHLHALTWRYGEALAAADRWSREEITASMVDGLVRHGGTMWLGVWEPDDDHVREPSSISLNVTLLGDPGPSASGSRPGR